MSVPASSATVSRTEASARATVGSRALSSASMPPAGAPPSKMNTTRRSCVMSVRASSGEDAEPGAASALAASADDDTTAARRCRNRCRPTCMVQATSRRSASGFAVTYRERFTHAMSAAPAVRAESGTIAIRRERGGTLGRGGSGGASATMAWAFVPPMPMELTPAMSGRPGSASSGRRSVLTKKGLFSKSISGLGVRKWMFGGSSRCRSASAVLIRPVTPAARSRWPTLALMELSAQYCRFVVLNALVKAATSMGSPSSVAVA